MAEPSFMTCSEAFRVENRLVGLGTFFVHGLVFRLCRWGVFDRNLTKVPCGGLSVGFVFFNILQ